MRLYMGTRGPNTTLGREYDMLRSVVIGVLVAKGQATEGRR
jgi:hypothetical protein